LKSSNPQSPDKKPDTNILRRRKKVRRKRMYGMNIKEEKA
jgi:hypothetical protein